MESETTVETKIREQKINPTFFGFKNATDKGGELLTPPSHSNFRSSSVLIPKLG